MLNEYAQAFDVPGVTFKMQDHLILIEIKNAFATAQLTTHGGSLLSFVPTDSAEDLLWVSPTALYNGKKPVRGGVPICWPWFGAHPTENDLPAHGFVRNAVWHLERVTPLASGETEVVMSFDSNEQTRALWPYDFHLELKVEIGTHCTMSLTTHNLSNSDMELTEAFHTYFNIQNPVGMGIKGLEKTIHLDKLTHAPAEKQLESVVLQPPKDSVFLNIKNPLSIDDEGHHRHIQIAHQGAQSSVVWNPGSEIVKGFSDIPNTAWQDFACIEIGNVLDNRIQIPSHEKHTLTQILSL